MKKYLALLIFTLAIISCSSTPTHYTVPAGYQTCRTDWDCKGPGHAPREFCGFVGVDTYAVCRQ